MEYSIAKGIIGIDVYVKRGNGTYFLYRFSEGIYNDLKENRHSTDARMLSYPVGDYEALISEGAWIGQIPRWQADFGVLASPTGIVLELNNYYLGKMARSEAIPWAEFEKAIAAANTINIDGVRSWQT